MITGEEQRLIPTIIGSMSQNQKIAIFSFDSLEPEIVQVEQISCKCNVCPQRR